MQWHLSEGRIFLEQALAASPQAASALRARALSFAAHLALYQQLADQTGIASCLQVPGICATWRGEFDQARALLEESAALYRARGNMYRLGWSPVLQGVMDQAQGQHVDARAHYEEALALFRDRDLGIVEGIAMMHFQLGLLLFYCQGDTLSARSFLEEASRLFRAEGNTAGVAVSLLRSAEVALLGQGNLVAAYVLAEEALGFFRELSYKGGVAEALFVLARVQARQGNYLAARSRYEDILTLAMKGDDTRHIHVAYRVEQSRDRIGAPARMTTNRISSCMWKDWLRSSQHKEREPGRPAFGEWQKPYAKRFRLHGQRSSAWSMSVRSLPPARKWGRSPLQPQGPKDEL